MNIQHRLATMAITVTAVVATTLAGTTAANAAPEGAAKTDNGVVSGDAQITPEVAALAKARGAGVQDALGAYWTPERMKAALPDTEIPAVKAAAARARTQGQTATTSTGPQGAAQRVEGTASTVLDKTAVQNNIQNVSPDAFNPGFPIGHPTALTTGKVFFTLGGSNFVCSGSTVNTEGKAAVWTAGHCLSGSGQFASNWCFVPNYVNGSAPFGVWCAYQLWTRAEWIFNGDFRFDIGAALMFSQFGFCISNYLGAQGIAWNFPIGQFVLALGYPAAPPFDGQILWAEQGSQFDGATFPIPTPGTIFMVNFMTGGSSGGPWLAFWNGAYGYINGHNDFKYIPGFEPYMFSPYYGNQVADLYNTIRFAGC